MKSGDFNLGSNSYFFLGNQNRYATGFIFDIDDIIIFDGSVDSSFKPDDYVPTSIFTQLLVIDSSGQVWGYSWDGSSSSSGGGDSDIMLKSLASVEDEFIVPDNISILQYSLSDNDNTIVRAVEVAPTDVFKYYSEYDNDNVYTLAVYDLDGNLKHKAYTTSELANSPIVDIKYGAGINNLNPDEYNGYINGSTTTLSISKKLSTSTTDYIVPDGIYKIRCYSVDYLDNRQSDEEFYISVKPGYKLQYWYIAPAYYIIGTYTYVNNTVVMNTLYQHVVRATTSYLHISASDAINKCGITTKPNFNDYICSYFFDSDASVTIPAGIKYYYSRVTLYSDTVMLSQTFDTITDTSVQHMISGEYVTSEHEVYMYLDGVKVGGGRNDSKKLYWYILYIKE